MPADYSLDGGWDQLKMHLLPDEFDAAEKGLYRMMIIK